MYVIELVNAKSNGNIVARYQDRYQSDNYDLVLVFCDTDRKPHKDYQLIRHKIDDIFGIENSSDKVLIFVSPCTLQINLLHFDDIKLRTQNKKKNASDIERLTGIKQYKASKEQRFLLFSKITKANYKEMQRRAKSLSENFDDVPSSNFYKFTTWFENTDTSRIDDINKVIEGIC